MTRDFILWGGWRGIADALVPLLIVVGVQTWKRSRR